LIETRPIAVATTKCFFDSNVLLYLLEDDDPRSAVAEQLVRAGGTISVQVLNEFANIATKKFKMEPAAIVDSLAPVRGVCEIVPLELSTHDLSLEIKSVVTIGLYDANIVAAAILAGCDTLYSEDLNHGQRIGGVEIRNPFKTG
jgi:predicted nucleic acid-binding protein